VPQLSQKSLLSKHIYIFVQVLRGAIITRSKN